MTSKRSTRTAAHKPAHTAADKPPKEPPTITITPAVGPNPDGIGHQIAIAHQLDEKDRAALEKKLTASSSDAEE